MMCLYDLLELCKKLNNKKKYTRVHYTSREKRFVCIAYTHELYTQVTTPSVSLDNF